MTRQPDSYYNDNFVITLPDGQRGIYVTDGTTKQFISTASSRSATAGAVPALNKFLLARTRALVQIDERQKHGNTGSYAEGGNAERDLKDTELFFKYLQKGRVYNLTDILENADPVGKVFYVPSDCYYIGDQDVPEYSAERASKAIDDYNKKADERAGGGTPLPTATAQDNNNWIWLLLPVGALLLTRFMKSDGGNERKRKH